MHRGVSLFQTTPPVPVPHMLARAALLTLIAGTGHRRTHWEPRFSAEKSEEPPARAPAPASARA